MHGRSHASVAPEKKVKPRPSRIEAMAQPHSGALICHISRYRRVETSRVAVPSTYEN